MKPYEIRVVFNNIPRIRKNARAGFQKIIFDTSRKIHGEILLSMMKPKHGRVYWGKSGRRYRASAPGEAPAIDTAKYYRSIRNKWATGIGVPRRSVRVVYTKGVSGRDPDLPLWLERGSPGGKIKKRPHFVPAAKKYRRPFIRAMKKELKRINK